jgi:hypothetical protein
MANLAATATSGVGAADGRRLAERERGTNDPYAIIMRRARAGAADSA